MKLLLIILLLTITTCYGQTVEKPIYDTIIQCPERWNDSSEEKNCMVHILMATTTIVVRYNADHYGNWQKGNYRRRKYLYFPDWQPYLDYYINPKP